MIDCTLRGERSFFGAGIAAHVEFDDPVCPRLADAVASAAEQSAGPVHRGRCYLAIEGPRWFTRAEAALYRRWGADVVGMTAMPEAGLAREAELPYALLAIVRRPDAAFAGARDTSERLAVLLRTFVRALPEVREDSPIDHALAAAAAI